MKIVFMGTPDFAVPCLEALINDGCEIAAVFTQPDKPKGRGNKLTAPPVKECALSHGIAVYQPDTLKGDEAMNILTKLSPDMIVVVAYGKLLPKAVLELPVYGCINVHASLLPEYRGAAPIQRVILDGRTKTGVTAMLMDEGLDTGDMLMKAELEIGENENSEQLHDRLSALGAELIVRTVHAAADGSLVREKQDSSKSCYAAMLTKEMSPVDFTRTAKEIHDQIRGLYPWPCASAVLNGKRVKLHSSRLAQGCGRPGQVLSLEPFTVACGEGAIELLEVQAEGRKKMPAAAFVNGLHASDASELCFEADN